MIRKRTGVILFIFGIFTALIISSMAYFTYTLYLNKNPNHTASHPPEKGLSETTPTLKVFSVVRKIERNEEITLDKTKILEVSKDATPSNAILNPENILNKKAAISIEPNTILTGSMLYSTTESVDKTDRLKDYDIPGGLVGGLVDEGQYIDIQFVSPKGATYIVLAKKQVKKKLDNNRIILRLSFEEQKLMNYALAEQKALGGKLETVIYADPTQPAPKPNYPIPKLNSKTSQATDTPISPITTSPLDSPVKGGF